MGTKAALSEAEYLRTSFPGVDQEYRDGELVERSVPDYFHGKTQGRIFAHFERVRKSHRVYPCTELRLRVREGRYLIPDVAIFWPDEPGDGSVERPAAVVEILSPDDRMSDVHDKLQEYAEWGVPNIWLVDPRKRRFYVCKNGLHEVEQFRMEETGIELRREDLFD